MDFNDALQEVGDFGVYQKLLCMFLVVPSASLCALVYFTQFFIILVPEHRCRLYEEENFHLGLNSSNLTVPFEVREGQVLPMQCEMYISSNYSFNWEANLSDRTGETMKCQNGWIYDFSELYPTVATEMNWVCEHDQLPYQSQTIFYVGTSIGCIIFGLIADRFGRRPSIILSYVIACVAGIGTAFTKSFYTFNFLRFFVGATIIPLSEDPYVLSLEYIGVKKRTFVIIIWSMGYIVFSAICPWIAFALRDWRLLCIITSAPLAAIPLCGKLIPESASWLLTRGRRKEAIKLLKIVARINKRDYSEEFADIDCDKNEEANLNTTALDLFRTPRLRRNTLVLAVTWFVVYCCYHTNTQNASNLGTNVYDSFTYSALVEIPALFVILFGIDWLGRRWPVVFSSLLAGVAGIIIIIIPQDSTKTYLGLALIQRVTLTIVYNVIMQYSAELLPTVLRGRGLAFLRLMGTLGLYLSPSIVYLSLTRPGLPLVVSGVLLFVIAAITTILPETVHQHLPHSVEEGENFGKDQHILECPCLNKRNYMGADKESST
ncbi:carcinine transporter-like isoform X2 [Stegodyphus dumicola]|uniref:carcinine transporter-like isoform X2 n=1 Tax=Stegodyphus dumicola TaxID=202533 RepID=UPI0015AA156D|nr:carcinine transporter-like isoform X2 [Stegodyphus dumicola]